MISYLSGEIVFEKSQFIIVSVHGCGYKISVLPTLENRVGNKINLFTHQNLREDCSDLYGFKSYEELELFEKLISVSGVGPKVGMSIMSVAPVEKIIQSISGEDSKFFESVSGVGKKAAVKIILELKNKISGEKFSGKIGAGNLQDVYDGLETLGYKKNEIDQIIGGLPKELITSEEKIRWCLKNLSKS